MASGGVLCCVLCVVAFRAVLCRVVPSCRAVPCRAVAKNPVASCAAWGALIFGAPFLYIGSKYVRKGTIPYGTLPYIPYIGTYVPTGTVRTHMIPAWVRTKFGDLPGLQLHITHSFHHNSKPCQAQHGFELLSLSAFQRYVDHFMKSNTH